MSVATVIIVVFVSLALFAVGLCVGWALRSRRVVGLDRPATVREVREARDQMIVVVLTDQAQRNQAVEDAKRAQLYGPVRVDRDTSAD